MLNISGGYGELFCTEMLQWKKMAILENMPSSLQGVFLDCILGWAVQWFGGLKRPPDLVEKKRLRDPIEWSIKKPTLPHRR